jgi:hypothetical protein
MPAVRELTFQLERFEWVASDRLELAGRWDGLRGRRIAPPVLAFEADGRRHRLRAMPGGQLDERWRATFAWDGRPVEIDRAELEVGRTVVVDLPAPRRRKSADRPAEPLEERLAAAEAEAEAARDELALLRADLSTAADETEQALSAEREVEDALRQELEAARAELTAAREELERTKGLLEHRDAQLGATRAGLDREREELRGLRERLAGVTEELERQREETMRLRERDAEVTDELEREREEAMRLRERAAEPATEAIDEESDEWPLEPAPMASHDEAPADDPATVPFAADEEPPAEPDTNGVGGEAPSVQVWASRVSEARQESGGERPRTLELPGLDAVKEKGAKALSSLLGRDGDGEPEAVPARPRAIAASRAGTRVRPPRGAHTRTVRQHSTHAIWAMRIAAVAVLLVLVVLLAVVLNVLS